MERPELLGELAGGLFALAREQVADAPELVAALDRALQGLGWTELMRALPALRLAFTWFPPRERDAIARRVLALHGREDRSVARLRELDAPAEAVTRALELEARADAIEARHGIGPSEEGG